MVFRTIHRLTHVLNGLVSFPEHRFYIFPLVRNTARSDLSDFLGVAGTEWIGSNAVIIRFMKVIYIVD